jgi:hypothetical protein
MATKPENRAKAGRKRTGNRGSFKKGKSGNPGGRPKLPPEYKLAMEDLGPRGLQALSDIIENPFHPRREQAAEYIVNRWKGTPTQRIEQSGPDGGPIAVTDLRMTREEMRRELEVLEAAERVAGSEPGEPPGDGE